MVDAHLHGSHESDPKMNEPHHRSSFLFTWNPDLYPWEKVRQEWTRYLSGQSAYLRWSCGRSTKPRAGDAAYLMRLRSEPYGIIAFGTITSKEPYTSIAEHTGEEQNFVDMQPHLLLDPTRDALFDPRILNVDYNWTPQSSGVLIREDAAAALSTAILQLIDQQPITFLDKSLGGQR